MTLLGTISGVISRYSNSDFYQHDTAAVGKKWSGISPEMSSLVSGTVDSQEICQRFNKLLFLAISKES